MATDSQKKALITGSFDPPTVGHLELIRVGAKVFEELVVCIFRNSEKRYMFSENIRKQMLEEMIAEAGLTNVTVDISDGFVADYTREKRIGYVLRGARGENDLAYEGEMAKYNHDRNPEMETLVWMAFRDDVHVSSTLVRKSLQSGDFSTPFITESVRKIAKSALVVG